MTPGFVRERCEIVIATKTYIDKSSKVGQCHGILGLNLGSKIPGAIGV